MRQERAGDYTELQVGPAASQEHVFPVVAESEYQWTEWFAAWMADPKTMQDADYNVAMQAVATYLVRQPAPFPQLSSGHRWLTLRTGGRRTATASRR